MQYSIFQFSEEKISSISQNLSFWQGISWQNILKKSHQAEEVFYF